MNTALECVPGLQIPEVPLPLPTSSNGYSPGRPIILPPIVSAHDFLQQEHPLPAELVTGLIHRGTQTLFAGGSKSFKTWILINLAVCVAKGAFLGARHHAGTCSLS